MNKIIKIVFVAVIAMFTTQTADAQLLKNLLGGAATEAAKDPKEIAYSNGQTSGAALKALYSQYKADGNNLNMNNMQNMLNLASLATGVQGLKEGDAAYKKEFVKGLVLGSTNLVTNNNSTSVLSSLTSFANMDLSSLLTGAAADAKQAATTATENAAKKALSGLLSGASQETKTQETASQIENVAEIASSVSSILNLFK